MEENRKNSREKKKEIVIDLDKLMFGLCVGVSVIATGISLYSVVKLNGFSKELGISINELRRKTHVEITDDLMNKYTNRAVQQATDRAAKSLANDLRSDMNSVLQKQAEELVKDQYDFAKDEVVKVLTKKASDISTTALRSEAKDAAIKIMTDKLEGYMENYFDSQTDNITNMAKAYKDMGEFIKNKA